MQHILPMRVCVFLRAATPTPLTVLLYRKRLLYVNDLMQTRRCRDVIIPHHIARPGLSARPLHASASGCILAYRFSTPGSRLGGEQCSSTALEAVLKRDRLLVFGGLVGITALSWAYTGYLAWSMDCMNMAMPHMQTWGVTIWYCCLSCGL